MVLSRYLPGICLFRILLEIDSVFVLRVESGHDVAAERGVFLAVELIAGFFPELCVLLFFAVAHGRDARCDILEAHTCG